MQLIVNEGLIELDFDYFDEIYITFHNTYAVVLEYWGEKLYYY